MARGTPAHGRLRALGSRGRAGLVGAGLIGARLIGAGLIGHLARTDRRPGSILDLAFASVPCLSGASPPLRDASGRPTFALGGNRTTPPRCPRIATPVAFAISRT